MPLTIGSALGAYEILAQLGAGGMGEVYRARDTRLDRDVAIKIVSGSTFADPESLARFRREAQLLAALNHQNIATIHAIEEAGGTQFIVLELVDGETLDQLILRGPIAVERTLEIAAQIVAALDAAHDQGIVHRDLKPSNIALTKAGVVKVLDFGLAKREDRASAASAGVTGSPTITALSPASGVLLGTAAYMSPEQARGFPTDRRCDIWAFGCIVYEMLTGARLFAAPTVTDTLAAVLTRQPDWHRVPPRVRRLLQHCLQPDPKHRLRDIGDAALLLDESSSEPAKAARLPWVVAMVTVAALAAALVLLRPDPVDRPLMRVAIDLGGRAPPVALAGVATPRGASWGDDGNIVAALSNGVGLSVMAADGGGPRPLTVLRPGEITHRWPQVLPGAQAVIFIANAATINSYEDATIDVQSFATGERKTLWRGGYFGRYVPTEGSRGHLLYIRGGVLFAVPFDPVRLEIQGTPTRLADDVAADPGSGAGHFDFSRTGAFLYQSGAGLQPWVVSWLDATGRTEPLLTRPGLYYSPRVSPDGRRLAIGFDEGKGQGIYAYDWQRDVLTPLTFAARGNSDPVWAPDSRHLLFRRSEIDRGLWWTAADGSGQPVRLLDVGVSDLGPGSLSGDGRLLVYSSPRRSGSDSDLWIVTLDLSDADRPKAGTPEPFFPSPANETRPALSPDGRWVAYVSNEGGPAEIYVRAVGGTAARAGGQWKVSSGSGGEPVWSRTGQALFFMANLQMMVAEYQVVDGTFVAGKPRVWTTMPRLGNTGFSRYDVAPDGRRMAILARPPGADEETARTNLLLNFFDEIRRVAP